MRRLLFLMVAVLILAVQAIAQVGINKDGSLPNPSAGLDVKFTDKGFLPPRLTSLQRDAIASPATGLVIFNTDCNDLQFYNGGGWVPVSNTGMLSKPGTINGNSAPCVNETGVIYYISTILGATGYNWTVPAGATITGGQGTNSITVTFGTSDGLICVAPFNGCMKGEMNCLNVTLAPGSPAGVSIVASANQICSGTSVTFTATPVNGGSSPEYQWKVNGINAGTNSPIYSYTPVDGDAVTCVLTSNATCITGNPATSNTIIMTVNQLPEAPVAGTHIPSETQIVWNWNAVTGATGYKWSNDDDYASATDMGTATSKTETGLTCNTRYWRYVWAYNICGHSTAVTLSQTTSSCSQAIPCPGIPTVEYGGQTYNTVQIGIQCWLKENLNIGTMINGSQNQANNGTIEKYCYNNLELSCNTYGGLYQWDEAMQYVTTPGTQGICPAGWHMPTDAEWTTLTTYLGGEGVAGGKLKEIGTVHWLSPNTGATNSSGFTALPGGYKGNSGNFLGQTSNGYFWTSTDISTTEVWSRQLDYNDVYVGRSYGYYHKVYGLSCRCLKDTCTSFSNVSVTITPSANPVCSGTSVTFTAIPVNGGSAPVYQWNLNGPVAGTNSPTYTFTPLNGDAVTCVLTSNAACITGNPATSNTIIMTVNQLPAAPAAGTHVPSETQIVWNWNAVTGATGYKWSNDDDFASATDMGMATSKTETGLTCNTAYTRFVWAYNMCGHSTASTLTQTTSVCGQAIPCPGIPTVEYGGQTYNTVQIGTQCWLKENLNIGTKINGSQNQADNGTIEKYCYNNLESNCNTYGGLYQWDEAMQYVTTPGTQGICPAGWHMPTDAEWTTLTTYLGGEGVAGGKMKETGTTHWFTPNTGATNESGFTALPGGHRDHNGGFYPPVGITYYGYFWSSSQVDTDHVWARYVYYFTADVHRDNDFILPNGFSVRCLKEPCTSFSNVSVTITPSANPICAGAPVTFTAIPVNGGSTPVYQWKLNGTVAGTNSPTYTFTTLNGDAVTCVLTSNAACITGNPATSNTITMTVNPLPSAPAAGTHVPSDTQITWNWNAVIGASGFKWSNDDDYASATDMGIATSTTETGLTCNTAYTRFVWAYNSCGHSTAVTLSQTTSVCIQAIPCPGISTIVYGGQTYNTVQIGTQCWLKENLNIGTRIDGSQHQTNNGIIEKYCAYDDESYCNVYGGLYQWPEIMQYVTTECVQGICPEGWHIPSDIEWTTLTTYLGGEGIAGGKMKEAGLVHWLTPNSGATNSSGFTALPGGWRYNCCAFDFVTRGAAFWSSSQIPNTNVWQRNLGYALVNIGRGNDGYLLGYSVRCLKDTCTTYSTVSVSISPSANPICSGSSVTFTATPANGGSSPAYQWKVNGTDVGTNNPAYNYTPVNGDAVTCIFTSNATCITGNPATSNTITMTVNPLPATPTAGTHVPSGTQIVWNWNSVSGATGYKFNTTNDYSTATDMSTATSKTETGLTCNTQYTRYIWAYNSCGHSTETALTQTTTGCPCPGIPTVAYGGQTYNTVQIGTQCWLKENLNIGTRINGSQNQTNNGTIEKYCYNDLEPNCDIYGGLYQWDEAMQYGTTFGIQGICPAGWHLPTDAEWTTLTTYLGGEGVAGGMMKETGLIHWASPNAGATNSSGFTLLGAGHSESNGTFNSYLQWINLWSSSNFSGGIPWSRAIGYKYPKIFRDSVYESGKGFSVRCLKDTCTTYSTVSVSIIPSANPICAGSSVTFTATPVNGGSSPAYQWKVNGNIIGTNNPAYNYTPVNGDAVTCVLTSNATCITGNPATSNTITMTVNPLAATPVAGTHVPSQTQIIWNWNTVAGATGYKFNTTNDYSTATDMSTATSKTETGLICNTQYTRYVWAYNSCGNSNVGTLTQTTSACNLAIPCPGIPTVIYGGQTYNTVQIGTQCWLKENLNIGTRINGSQNQANNSIIEKYCYNDLDANCDTYGGLYQWDEAMQYVTTPGTQGICPVGWHIPLDDEWKVLEGTVDSLYGVGNSIWDNTGWRGYDAGKNLKTTTGWNEIFKGTDLFGFSGLPGGLCYNGSFTNGGSEGGGYWWTSSKYANLESCDRSLYANASLVYRSYYTIHAFSVRCLKE